MQLTNHHLSAQRATSRGLEFPPLPLTKRLVDEHGARARVAQYDRSICTSYRCPCYRGRTTRHKTGIDTDLTRTVARRGQWVRRDFVVDWVGQCVRGGIEQAMLIGDDVLVICNLSLCKTDDTPVPQDQRRTFATLGADGRSL